MEEEEDPIIPSDNLTEAHNKGGHLPGSTMHSWAHGRQLEERKENGKERLESVNREELFKRAIEMFQIEGKFDVPMQTIFSHIALERLKV